MSKIYLALVLLFSFSLSLADENRTYPYAMKGIERDPYLGFKPETDPAKRKTKMRVGAGKDPGFEGRSLVDAQVGQPYLSPSNQYAHEAQYGYFDSQNSEDNYGE